MLILFSVIAAVWFVTLIVVTWGVRRLHTLRDVAPYNGPTKSVSVIVAARNEGHTIEAALSSLLHQDYPDYEIIVANDRSTDKTGEILARLNQQYPQLKTVTIEELPKGWIGKNHALQRGADMARGEYLLFTDADVVMQSKTLSRAVAYAESERLDHIAVFPDLPAPNYWTGAFYSLFGFGFLMLTQPWFKKTLVPVGVGAFNFIRRTAYDAAGQHTKIPLRPDDDVALARKLRESGATSEVLIGAGQISVEWYSGLREATRGLEKNAFAPLEYSLPLFVVVVLLHFVSYVLPWLGLFAGGWITIVCTLIIAAQMLSLASTGRIAGSPWKHAPVMPLAALAFELILTRAVFLTLKNGGIRWRDTFYSLEQLRSNRLVG